MHLTWILSLCISALTWRRILAAPVNISLEFDVLEDEHALSKRDTAGPQLGGVNFPDPSIIQANGIWYSFATRNMGSSVHIQVARSDDFIVWGLIYNQDGSQYDALPNLPSWVYRPNANTWAPDVQQLSDGTFIMYYSATIVADLRLHCVGAAKASNVLGPYVPLDEPFVCPTEQGGAIDASGYEADGQRYVLYKVDGNALGNGGPCGNAIAPIVPTPIILQPVASDGLTPQGSPVALLDNIGPSDDGVIEAPSLIRSSTGTWVLFFSSGCFTSPRYTVSYATADSPTGPFIRAAQPLFATGDRGLKAPGGMSIWTDARHMLFHGNYGSGRALYTATVAIGGSKVTA